MYDNREVISMSRKILSAIVPMFFVCVIMLQFVSCGSKDTQSDSEIVKETIKATEGITEKSSTTDGEFVSEEETVVDIDKILSDERLSWRKNSALSCYTGTIEGGVVATDDPSMDMLFEDYAESDDDKLYVIGISEYGGNSSIDVYDRFFKQFDLVHMHSDITEEEIREILKKSDESEYVLDRMMIEPEFKGEFFILAFMTYEQIIEMEAAGCPEDMMVVLRWYSKEAAFVR